VQRAYKQRAMFVFAFHGIGTGRGELAARLLEQHVRFLTRRFEIVPLDVVVAALEGRREIRGGEVALTFDDGLRTNVTLAYPILARHRAPATFFVCPGLVEEGRWQWGHELRARLALLPAAEWTEAVGIDGRNPVEALRAARPAERLRAEERLRELTPGFAPTAAQRLDLDVASWDELRSLDPEVVSIGSHGMTHVPLIGLDDAALEHELRASRLLLAERLQREVPILAYPYGFADERVRAAAGSSYDAGVGNEPGAVRAGSDRYDVPRLSFGESTAETVWMLAKGSSAGAPVSSR
jgi:peptidoglycan/xylan/chitin deacetylase (PgdA/CDA1 family)